MSLVRYITTISYGVLRMSSSVTEQIYYAVLDSLNCRHSVKGRLALVTGCISCCEKTPDAKNNVDDTDEKDCDYTHNAKFTRLTPESVLTVEIINKLLQKGIKVVAFVEDQKISTSMPSSASMTEMIEYIQHLSSLFPNTGTVLMNDALVSSNEVKKTQTISNLTLIVLKDDDYCTSFDTTFGSKYGVSYLGMTDVADTMRDNVRDDIKPDILVLNHIVTDNSTLMGTDSSRTRDIINKNFVATSSITRHLVPDMVTREYGKIVYVDPMFDVYPSAFTMNLSKTGFQSITSSTKKELSAHNIAISHIHVSTDRRDITEDAKLVADAVTYCIEYGIKDYYTEPRFYNYYKMCVTTLKRIKDAVFGTVPVVGLNFT